MFVSTQFRLLLLSSGAPSFRSGPPGLLDCEDLEPHLRDTGEGSGFIPGFCSNQFQNSGGDTLCIYENSSITLNSDYDKTTSRVRRSIIPNYLKSVFDYFLFKVIR